MEQKDYYAILEVPPGADLSMIEVSYWRLARRYNRALAADHNASRLLKDLNEAYETLTAPPLAGGDVGSTAAIRRPKRRLWRWWRRHARNGKQEAAPEEQVGMQPPTLTTTVTAAEPEELEAQPPTLTTTVTAAELEELEAQPATPMATVAAVEPEELGALEADSQAGPGAQLETAAREGMADEPQESRAPEVMAYRPPLLRWEMPVLQAIVASAGIATLASIALAAGADPALTLTLGGVVVFFCLVPWRFDRLPHPHLPPLDHPRAPGEAQRAAALRESTAAMVAGWRQSAGFNVSSVVAATRRGPRAHEAVISRLRDSAEAGRRLAIYERETGLLAHWYLSLRGREECERAARYNRPLTLLLVEPAPESNTQAVQGQLTEWLKRKVRPADITGYLGNGRFVMLMPETGMAAAVRTLARLQNDVAEVQTGLSAFGAEVNTFDDMYAAARQALAHPPTRRRGSRIRNHNLTQR